MEVGRAAVRHCDSVGSLDGVTSEARTGYACYVPVAVFFIGGSTVP